MFISITCVQQTQRHNVIKTSTAHAKLSIKLRCKSVNISHIMHMNDTMTEHIRTLHGDKTTGGTSNQFISCHHSQLLQTKLKLSVVFTHGTERQSIAGMFWARTVDGKPFINATEITQVSHHEHHHKSTSSLIITITVIIIITSSMTVIITTIITALNLCKYRTNEHKTSAVWNGLLSLL